MIVQAFAPSTVIDATATTYPSRLWTPPASGAAVEDRERTCYGFALEGGGVVRKGALEIKLVKGMYFSMTGPFTLSGEGKTVVVDRMGYRGLDQFGGPVEDVGRLRYIDGCRASVLVSPARLGDPVFNLLTFPPKVLQTKHIHPSIRLGLVFAGRGACLTPGNDPISLEPGMLFLLNEGEIHGFQSFEEPLVVIAYHPESDTGPTDEDHPMLNRTITNYKK